MQNLTKPLLQEYVKPKIQTQIIYIYNLSFCMCVLPAFFKALPVALET